MIQVSEAFQNAWLNGKQKYIELHFSDNSILYNESVVSESFKMKQALCEENQLAFGLTSSAEISVKIFNNAKQYKGLGMNVILSAKDEEDNIYSMGLGYYTITDDKRSDDRLYRTLTAYDPLRDVLSENYAAWYNTLGNTFTLKQFRDSFFAYIGITQETAALAQDSVTLKKKPNVTSLSGRDIIQGICETSAAFGFMNYSGRFQYCTPTIGNRHYPADDLYPSNTLYPGDGASIVIYSDDSEAAPVSGGLSYSDYYTHKITGAYFQDTENTQTTSVGTNVNRYRFSDSILFYDQSVSNLQGIASAFLSAASTFFYIPSKVKARARVWAQVGDMVLVQAGADSVLFPVLERTMNGITALYDTYSARGEEYYTYSANTTYDRITDVEARTHDSEQEIESINEEIDDPQTGLKAQIQTNAGNISLEVTNRQIADGALSSRIEVLPKSIDLNVSNSYDSASISLSVTDEKGSTIVTTAKTIQFTGDVIFASDLTDGTTVISGDNIKTGQISAQYIDTANLDLKTKSGYLETKLSSGRIEFYNYTYDDSSPSNAAYICPESNGNTLIIGALNNGRGKILLMANDGVNVSNLYRNTSSQPYLYKYYNSSGAQTTDIAAEYSTSDHNGIKFANALSGDDRAATIGYVKSKTTDSDIRIKLNVADMKDIAESYMQLRPVSYQFNPMISEDNEKYHNRFGLIAQEVMGVETDLVTQSTTIAGSCYEQLCGRVKLGINYQDLHAWHIQMIQKQQKKIEELESRLAILEGGN